MLGFNVFLSVLSLQLFAAANAQTTTYSEAIAELPACGISCILETITPSACALTNATCVCTNHAIQSNITHCVQSSCTFAELKVVGTITQGLCAGVPIESNTWVYPITAAVLTTITTIFVGLRCYSRLVIAQKLWWDDWTIIMATVDLIAMAALTGPERESGLGLHFWDIPPESIVPILKMLTTAELLYNFITNLTRISILLFYLRVFQERRFRLVVWITIAIIGVAGLVFTFILIFQCTPLSANWDPTLRISHCLDLSTVVYSGGGMGIAEDIIILFLPIPQLWSLQMDMRKKIGLLFMFSLGSVACVTSMLRLKFIVDFENTIDGSWDDVKPAVWSMVENSVAMTCACLPSLRAIIVRALSSLHTKTEKSKQCKEFQTGPSHNTNGKSIISTRHLSGSTMPVNTQPSILEPHKAYPPRNSAFSIAQTSLSDADLNDLAWDDEPETNFTGLGVPPHFTAGSSRAFAGRSPGQDIEALELSHDSSFYDARISSGGESRAGESYLDKKIIVTVETKVSRENREGFI